MPDPTTPPADPQLVAVAQQLLKARENARAAGQSIAPEDADAFVRRQTGGKYGALEAVQYLTSQPAPALPPTITRGTMADNPLTAVTDHLANSLSSGFADKIAAGAGSLIRHGDLSSYTPDLAALRASTEREGKDYPWLSRAGSLAGAVLNPLNKIPGGLVAQGAIQGGASALGNDDSGSLEHKALATGLGMTTGGVLGKTTGAIFGALPTQNAAIQKVLQAVGGSGGMQAALDKLAALKAAGRGGVALLSDLSPRLGALADNAANTSAEAFTQLKALTDARQASQGERLLDDTRAALGGELPHAPAIQQRMAQQTADWAAGPTGFGGIRVANPAIDASAVSGALNKPEIAQAWRQARLAGDINEGDPADALFQKLMGANPGADPVQARAAAHALTPPTGPRPISFDDLHSFKQLLDDKVGRAYASGQGALAGAFKTVRDGVTEALENVPGYASVNAQYAQRKGLEDALQQGVDAWGQNDSRGLAQQVAGMSPEQLDVFRKGMASELVTKLRGASTNRDQATQLVNQSPAMTDKLKIVFGGQEGAFDSYMNAAKQEAQLADIKAATTGSATARRLAAQATGAPTAAAVAGAALLHAHPIAAATALLRGGARNTFGALRESQSTDVGNLLATQGADPIAALLARLQQAPAAPVGVQPAIGAASNLLGSQFPALLGPSR
jgi:hypothetical protein